MAETGFESYEEPAEAPPSRMTRIKGAASTAIGALAALGLLLALGVWFYRLGVRDAQNVPIIRAATEPAKIRPAKPGGKMAPHQDIESYEVASDTPPANAAAAVIAPPPPAPKREDVAMGDLERAAEDAGPPPDPAPAAAAEDGALAVTPLPSPGRDAGAPPAARAADAAAERAPDAAPDAEAAEAADAAGPEPAAEPEPERLAAAGPAPRVSPVAPKRPADLAARRAAAADRAARAADDLAAAAAASPIQIQLAADPNRAAMQAKWDRVFQANRDLLRGRALSIQTTEVGGVTYYRLRVGPFRNRPEAVAVCQALKARGQDCIVARNS